ncbi:hypothetical protein TFLX_04549 [Thermoflexales bacterium]|nr:hypothetical protein TFLX_04549 [Thermoflexales bacterium]
MSAYLDKRLPAEEKDFFERHLALCADCHAQLESTRSMVAALRAMPLVKAPRSFVLPREMAKQPRRSFLTWYPALRLATVIAAMAFVVLFASDLLINQPGGGATPQSLPAAAPAPVVMQAPESARQDAPTEEPAVSGASNYDAAAPGTGAAPSETSAPTAKAVVTETMAITESTAMSMMTATPAATAVADTTMRAQMTVEATSELSVPDQQAGLSAEQSTAANLSETPTALEPLRVIEIALLALVIVLGAATFIVRRRQA